MNILLKRALIEESDYTEDFVRLSLIGFVGSTKIETYSVQFNCYLKDLFIQHELFQTNEKEKMKLF